MLMDCMDVIMKGNNHITKYNIEFGIRSNWRQTGEIVSELCTLRLVEKVGSYFQLSQIGIQTLLSYRNFKEVLEVNQIQN